MNTHRCHLEETRDFVKENLTQIVKEYAEWRKTGKLVEGKFREAVKKLDYVFSMGNHGSMDYVTGKLNVIQAIMTHNLIHDHLNRAGHFGESV